MEPKINLSDLSGYLLKIAEKIDKEHVENKIIEGEEYSIFEKECFKELHAGKIDIKTFNSIFSPKAQYEEFFNLEISNKAPLDRLEDKINENEKAIAKILEERERKDLEARKDEICTNLQNKWCGTFKKSPLKKDFFEKLFNVLDKLNVTIPDEEWDKDIYKTKKEQVMDRCVAIFAREAALRPDQHDDSRYYGLFQLNSDGLSLVKKWVKNHPNDPDTKKVKNDITLSGILKTNGCNQLDYLAAYIKQAKIYSKINSDEAITPERMWAMIKSPYAGKHTINNKTGEVEKTKIELKCKTSIDSTFTRNKIPKGIYN